MIDTSSFPQYHLIDQTIQVDFSSASSSTPSLSPNSSRAQSSASSSSSLSPPDSREIERRCRTKKRRKRSGKVLDALRVSDLTVAVTSPTHVHDTVSAYCLAPLNLAETCSMSRLGNIEMKASLFWHLISLSAQESRFVIVGQKRIADVLRNLASASRLKSAPYERIIYAALAAIGARRTFHSAITGIPPPRPSSSPDEIASLALGQRREAACDSLVTHAVDLVQDNNILRQLYNNLWEDSADELINVLRLALKAGAGSSTRDGTRKTLENILSNADDSHRAKKSRQDRPAMTVSAGVPRGRRTAERDAILVMDAYQAITTGRHLEITDEVLPDYGYSSSSNELIETDDHLQSPASTNSNESSSSPTLVGAVIEDRENPPYALVIHMTRALAKLRIEESKLTSNVVDVFEQLFKAVDQSIAVLQATKIDKVHAPHVFMLPLLTLSAVVMDASRRARAAYSVEAQYLIDQAQIRYLIWVKALVRILGILGPSSADNHIRAILISKLDFVPGWIEICVNAASQHRDEFGALAEAEFSFENLDELHEGLKLSTAIYANASRREADLSRALIAVEPEYGGSRRRKTFPIAEHELPSALDYEVGDLIQSALRDLHSNF